MLRLKIAVVGVFTCLVLVMSGGRYLAPGVSGRSSADDLLLTLSAPTGVAASDGDYSSKVGITWNAVRGATFYRILRNTTNDVGTATSVGTTAAPFFFDTTAVVLQQYTYWVVAENETIASLASAGDGGIRAAGIPQGPVPPLEPPLQPAGNPITASKFTLGKILFWDEQLSSTQTVACGTCHRPEKGGSDPRTIVGSAASTNPGPDQLFNTADDIGGSPGVPSNTSTGLYEWSNVYGMDAQVTSRKSPSYINAGYSLQQFWDGRATPVFRDPLTNSIILNNGASLESQSVVPPMSAAEMAHAGRNWTEGAAQIAVSKPLALSANVPESLTSWIDGRDYPELFEEAFGTSEVTPSRIAMAIATFERALFSDRTPFDRANADIAPLNPAEQRGRGVFNGNSCAVCHGGSIMSDGIFHNIGVRPQTDDDGRFTVTGNAINRGEFRTPSLRNVELRAPYMHNGRFATLEDVVEFYNRGGDFDAPNVPGNLIRPLNLTAAQKTDLVAFLRRPLTDNRVANATGPFERPQLYTESNRVPVIVGTGTAGSGSTVPRAIAIEPPIIGNPSFTVAVSNALGGATATLVIDSTDPGNTSSIPASGSFTRQTIQLSGSGAGGGRGSISLSIPDSPAFAGRTFFGRWYVVDAGAVGGVAVSQAFRFTVFGSAAVANTPFDYDGDGKTDISVWRPGDGTWHIARSGSGSILSQGWGLTGDKLAPADFDGDGKTDMAVFRESDGNWYIVNSQSGTVTTIGWGLAGDLPVPADYSGDGKADMAIFRPTEAKWYRWDSDGQVHIYQWGLVGDRPAPADFDGDGVTDATVYRPTEGKWYTINSTNGFTSDFQWGIAGDMPVAGDYSGDGKADFAVYRPSDQTWYRIHTDNFSIHINNWGIPDDLPVPGDYDGDGQSDLAVFRPSNSTWYIYSSTSTIYTQPFGLAGDKPTPNAFVY